MKSNFTTKATVLFTGIFSVLIIACSQSESDSNSGTTPSQQKSAKQTKENYQTIEWIDLMPQDDLDALMNPPEYLDAIEDGSDDDRLSTQLMLATTQAGDDRYMQALTSTRVMPEFDNRNIR